MIELYVKGDSWLHQLSAKWKFLGLIVFVTALGLSPNNWSYLGFWTVLTAVYLSTSLGFGYVFRMFIRLLPFILLIVSAQALTIGWEQGVRLSAQLYIAVLAAGLLTLTTNISEMLDTFEWALSPLEKAGIDTWRICLVLTLTLRSIPTVSRAFQVSNDAWKARGFGRPRHHIILPTLIRMFRSSEKIGDAISARNMDVAPPKNIEEQGPNFKIMNEYKV